MRPTADTDDVSRREVLRQGAFGTATVVGLAGCASDGGGDTGPPSATRTLTADPTASETPTPTPTGPSVASLVETDGHYAWFALSEGNWARQPSPYDIQRSGGRWLAEPTADGGIRCLVRAIDYYPYTLQSAGFDVHLGRLGDVTRIRIDSSLDRSGTLVPELAVALYIDEDGDGEFFRWEASEGGRDTWVGLGGDEEALVSSGPVAGEPLVIDDETDLGLVNRDAATTTFGRLKEGEIRYHDPDKSRKSGANRTIDGDTRVALYVGLGDTGKGEVVEAIVRNVVVTRS